MTERTRDAIGFVALVLLYGLIMVVILAIESP